MTELFGTDGIRGTVGEWPLVPEFFLKLGQVAGRILKTQKNASFIIGRDTRHSGAMLQAALSAGLLSSGVNIIDVRIIPTSAISWLIPHVISAEAGAVISASHNPAQQNGIKFFDRLGRKLSETIETEIEKLLLDDQFMPKTESHLGRLIDGNTLHELYIQDLLKEHPDNFLNGLSIVVDCSHGAASFIAPEVFQRAGAQVIVINASPTGSNINYFSGSEYIRRSPEKLGETIQQRDANFGLAFDGDADRVVFIDEEGTLIDGDYMLGFLARYLDQHDQLLARSVVTTTMRNNGLKNFIDHLGLHLHETPVGDKYVSEKLMELWNKSHETGKIGLGGEQAGHIILIDDNHITGDGLRTALFVLRAYRESDNNTLAKFAAGVGKTPQIIASAYVGNGQRLDKNILQELENQLQNTYPDLVRVNIRYSGTEPLFRVMLESNEHRTEEDLAQIATEVCKNAQSFANHTDGHIDILNCTRGGTINANH